MITHDITAATTSDPGGEQVRRLRRLNIVAGAAHTVQATVMIALANNTGLPVTASFATGPPGQPADAASIDELFTYPLGFAVALFSTLSAASTSSSHPLGASPAIAANSPLGATDSGGSSTRSPRRS